MKEPYFFAFVGFEDKMVNDRFAIAINKLH